MERDDTQLDQSCFAGPEKKQLQNLRENSFSVFPKQQDVQKGETFQNVFQKTSGLLGVLLES